MTVHLCFISLNPSHGLSALSLVKAEVNSALKCPTQELHLYLFQLPHIMVFLTKLWE